MRAVRFKKNWKTAYSQGVSINQLALYAFNKEFSELETNDYLKKIEK